MLKEVLREELKEIGITYRDNDLYELVDDLIIGIQDNSSCIIVTDGIDYYEISIDKITEKISIIDEYNLSEFQAERILEDFTITSEVSDLDGYETAFAERDGKEYLIAVVNGDTYNVFVYEI